jgi:hypothetical protein
MVVCAAVGEDHRGSRTELRTGGNDVKALNGSARRESRPVLAHMQLMQITLAQVARNWGATPADWGWKARSAIGAVLGLRSSIKP